MLVSMISRACLRASSLTSRRRTSNPASAETWAMPLPIWPAPMTPMVLIMFFSPFRVSRRLVERLSQCRHDLEEIADDAVIGDLKDWRLFILVDRDDDLAVLHAGEMLDRTGNPHRDIEVRRDDLSRLADLVIVRHITRIDRRPRCSHGTAELVGQLLQEMEVLARLHAASAGYDHPGGGQLRPFGAAERGADIARQSRVACRGRLFDLAGAA